MEHTANRLPDSLFHPADISATMFRTLYPYKTDAIVFCGLLRPASACPSDRMPQGVFVSLERSPKI